MVQGGRVQKPRQIWGKGTEHGRDSPSKNNVALSQEGLERGTESFTHSSSGKGKTG